MVDHYSPFLRQKHLTAVCLFYSRRILVLLRFTRAEHTDYSNKCVFSELRYLLSEFYRVQFQIPQQIPPPKKSCCLFLCVLTVFFLQRFFSHKLIVILLFQRVNRTILQQINGMKIKQTKKPNDKYCVSPFYQKVRCT